MTFIVLAAFDSMIIVGDKDPSTDAIVSGIGSAYTGKELVEYGELKHSGNDTIFTECLFTAVCIIPKAWFKFFCLSELTII